MAAWIALDHWVATAPVPVLTPDVSAMVRDREGRLVRAYQVADGRWRLPVRAAEVDAGYLAQLLAYEDRRYHSHAGVDPLAFLRAAGQAIWHGQWVSGASTLTMQVARLLTGGSTRSVGAKLAQMRLALALERRLDKQQTLDLYLTLAPFGGNIEGVRAASLSWFGKEPRRLTPAEAALLVAIPQAPEARRPDRAPARARAARDRVLDRAVRFGALGAAEAAAAKREPVLMRRRAFPRHAPHLSDRALATAGAGGASVRAIDLTVDLPMQKSLEHLARTRAQALPDALSLAILVADHRTGEVVASVGSPGLDQPGRQGFIDMTRAVRSPGSALKPLIYGLAFDRGLAHPESLVEDRPTAFGAYVPGNFGESYHGTVSVRTALQRSLNVPAVAVLEVVGPATLMHALRGAGARPVLPPGQSTGLAIALGGLGISLEGLVQVFAGIAAGGAGPRLRWTPGPRGIEGRILSQGAAWQVADILAGVPAPAAASNGQLAYKTGTSYGHRDAWAVGFDGAHVIGVWVGRPDATPVPGITGLRDAAPLMFEAFARLKPAPLPLAPPPGDVLIVSHADLPPPLRRLGGGSAPVSLPAPRIAFPPSGARVAPVAGTIALKVRDGRPPFTWLVEGQPIETLGLDREITWTPKGRGYAAISVIDGAGRSAATRIFVD